MSALITALAWLLIILTFTGTYRLAAYLAAADDATGAAAYYPVLIAATVTVSFVVMFDFVILLTGVAALMLPGFLVLNREKIPAPSQFRARAVDRFENATGSSRRRAINALRTAAATIRGTDHAADPDAPDTVNGGDADGPRSQPSDTAHDN